ncbi:inorganic pyrophosphatase [Trichoderma cornu-damae]|uniref:inorganic diphosphatase n=1 Tax=Trichoderma cornu-damae TaxID=654480 RepID=A0A9P8QFJ7_9HYPO|nr:inorganic pyrophosphatase [Trichoderma cornu-damae]
MRLTISLYLLHLAIAPVFSAATDASKSDDKAAQKGFDLKSLTLREVGARNTLDWRIWLEKDGNPISFWHDIPLYPDEKKNNIVNFYVEIPRWTDGKIETKRDKPLNPIFHDDKNDVPRYVASVWPHKSYPFLYGSLPQTWENSNVKHNFTGYPGDNDPMDVVDISAIDPGFVGQVRTVKILGGIPMIDDKTTDWKVIGINVEDPLSKLVDTIDDLEKYRPGLKQTFYDWFVYYKVLRSGDLNTIFGNQYQNSNTMRNIISESHGFWQDLISGKENPGKISISQTSRPSVSRSYIASKDATKQFNLPKKSKIEPAKARPAKYDKWFYLDENFQPLPEQVIDVD